MGRKFNLPHPGRALSIRVFAIDEGWELWIYEGARALMLGGTVRMDRALEAWRDGKDAVLLMAEQIRADFAAGKLACPPPVVAGKIAAEATVRRSPG